MPKSRAEYDSGTKTFRIYDEDDEVILECNLANPLLGDSLGGGGGLEYVETLWGESAAMADTSIATSSALEAGDYLLRFYSSTLAAVGSRPGYKVNAGSTVWVLSAASSSGVPCIASEEVTLAASDTLNLRGSNSNNTAVRYTLEIWRIT